PFYVALNYGQLRPQWVANGLHHAGQAAWAACLATLFYLAWAGRKRQAVVLVFLTWLLALATFIASNPPLEEPDEPQHLTGLLRVIPQDQQEKLRKDVALLADRTSFLVTAQTRLTPILQPDESMPKGLGGSGFD